MDFETDQVMLMKLLTTFTMSETEYPLPIYAVLKIHGETSKKY